jgi:hypothetical protein
LDRYSMLTSELRASIPVAVSSPMDFLYLVNYAPDSASQIYYIDESDQDFFVRVFRDLEPWFPVKYNQPIGVAEFLRRFPEFLMYGEHHEGNDLFQTLNRDHKIRSWTNDPGHYLIRLGAGTATSVSQ